MKKLNEELFINVKKGYSKDLKEKFKKSNYFLPMEEFRNDP